MLAFAMFLLLAALFGTERQHGTQEFIRHHDVGRVNTKIVGGELIHGNRAARTRENADPDLRHSKDRVGASHAYITGDC